MAADSGRSGGVPMPPPPEPAEKDPDDSRPLLAIFASPSYEPRLPMLPLRLRPARPSRPDSPKLPLLLPPPQPQLLPTELQRGRRTAVFRRLSAPSRSFRRLYRASRPSIVRPPSASTSIIGEFSSSFSLLLGVGEDEWAGDDDGGDDEGEGPTTPVVVGRKSASESDIAASLRLAFWGSGIGAAANLSTRSAPSWSIARKSRNGRGSKSRNRKQRLCRLQQAGRLVITLSTG